MGTEYLNNIIKDLSEIDSKEEQLKYLLDIGQTIDEFNIDSDQNQVPGCAANTYLTYEIKENKFYFGGDSESLFGKSYIVILSNTFRGMTKEEILNTSSSVSDSFNENISSMNMIPSRMNSFGNIFNELIAIVNNHNDN